MKLNLGAGRRPLDGYVNVDRHAGPGINLVVDLDNDPLPFPPGTVDEVYSRSFLEHVVFFERVMQEVYRVLRPGGRMVAVVPVGLRALENPYHRRTFSGLALRAVLYPGDCADVEVGAWSLVSKRITERAWFRGVSRIGGFPFWHIRRYLGVCLPVAPAMEMEFVIEKVAVEPEDVYDLNCPVLGFRRLAGTWVILGDPLECPKGDLCGYCWVHELDRTESIEEP